MAVGVIIGRVAVKVIPDTSDFKETLQRDLNRIEKTLDNIEIKIDVDTDTVVQEAKRARQKAQDQMKDLRLKVNLDSEESIKRSLGSLNRELERLGEIDIDVDLNEGDLRAAMDILNDQLDAVRTVKIKVDEADPASVRSAVNKINDQLAEIRKIEIDVLLNESTLTQTRDRLRDQMDKTYREIRQNVQDRMANILIGMDVDPVQAARTLRKIEVLLEQIEDAKMTITPDMDERARFATLRKIQDLKDQVSDMEATIHPDLDAPAALALSARLALLARDRFVEYIPRMNKAAAATLGNALARASGARLLGGYMRDLYNSVLQFDKSIPKIIGMSLAIGGLGATGLASVSNLAALSSSLASIVPAGLALPGIFGGIAVGVGVMITALKDFNEVFPDVKATLSEMQDSISDNFWAGAKASMREMIDALLPALKDGFDGVATSLGGFSSQFTSAVTDQLVPALGPMFASLRESIDIAAGAADNIVGIITTLGTVGSSYLPRLATWFADITTQFDEFLKRSTESGEIFTWIDTGIEALKDLGRVLGNAALILSDIAQAATAGGGSQLSTLADGLERIRDITKSADFQKTLTGVFEAAHTAMGNIATISGPAVKGLFGEIAALATAVLPQVGETIGRLVRGIATALTQPEVTSGIRTMFDGIANGVRQLEPIWEPLGRAIGTLGPLVGNLAITLGSVLGAAIPPVADALTDMGDAIAPLIPAIGTVLLAAVEALTPVITNLANGFVSFMEGGALDLLVAGFEGFAAAITMIPAEVLTAIAVAIGAIAIAAGIMSAVFTAINFVIGIWNVVVGVATAVTWLFNAALAVLTSPITLVILAIVALIAIGVLLYKHWDEVKAFAEKVWKAIAAEVDASWENMKTKTKAAWQAIKDEFNASWENLKAKTKAGWQAVKDEFVNSWNNLKEKTLAGWQAVKDEFTNSWNNLKDKTNAGWQAVKDEFTNSWQNLKDKARAGWEAIKEEFRASFENLKTKVSGGWTSIKTEFTNAWEGLKTQASQAWTSVVEFFTEGVANAVRAVAALPGGLTAIKWAATLVQAGRDVIDGFIDGITGAFGRVRDTLSTLTGMLPDWKGPATRDKVILTDAGRLIIEGLVKGMESQYDSVKKSLRGLTDDLGGMVVASPTMAAIAQPAQATRSGLVGGVRTAVVESQSLAAGKTLIYNAAPGSSLGSEEDLFAAADRGRMVGW